MYSIALGHVGEKGGGSAFGHACGVRVNGAAPRGLWPPVGGGLCSLALRGQRPFGPRGVVAADAADLKKGARLRRGLCRRVVTRKVDGPPGRRLWPPVGGGLCSLRSGGRRLAVRKTIEYQIGALSRTPFPAAREFAPMGSMLLDSRVAGLPYESSSFATSRGNERYEEKNRGVICVMYYSSISPFGGWPHYLPSGAGRWCRKAPKGGKPPEVADYRSAYHNV